MPSQAINEYVYLIDMSDIASLIDISGNISENRVNAQIKNAQDFDLRLFLGDAFYWNLLSNFDTGTGALNPAAPALIKKLYEGGSYNDLAGNPIFFQGLVPALVYMSFARFVEFDPIQYTSTGPVIKHHDLSDALKVSELGKIVASYRSMANSHVNNIEKFLYINKTSFPLWRVNERNKSSRQPGARIRDVDRTAYNGPAYGGYNGGLDGYGGLINGY